MNDGAQHESAFSSRAEILNQGVKGLFIANGGAAIAVLAFLGEVVEKNSDIAAVILGNLPWYAYGLICAVLVYFVRFFRAFFTKSAEQHTGADVFTAVWVLLAAGSLVCFSLATIRIGNAGAEILAG